jgi:hypothetical protein
VTARSPLVLYATPVIVGVVIGSVGVLVMALLHFMAGSRDLEASIVGATMAGGLAFSWMAFLPWRSVRILVCMAVQIAVQMSVVVAVSL